MSCKCCCTHENAVLEKNKSGLLKKYLRIIFSGLLLFTGLFLDAMDISLFQQEYITFCCYLLAYLPVGLPVLKEAWESITQKDIFSEFTLMSLATVGAFYIGEYPEGVAVMLFYSLGELLQEKAVEKAKRNISSLLDIRPETVTVIKDNESVIEASQTVKIGEVIEVKAGERVPLDGVMLSEEVAFNTAALTGESTPRHIRRNEEVLAGMISTDRVVRIQVTRTFEKSALSRILELVQDASERKAPAELFIRKFARIYTPIVIGLAVLVVLLPFIYSLINGQFLYIFDEWLYKALVFWVISCPCALVVSIPLGYFGGIGAASRLGVLFKGGNYLDAVTRINAVVFDKTGTLTQGSFEVQSCKTQPDISEERLLQLVTSAELNSTHPIAKAIVSYARKKGIEPIAATDVTEIAGYGLQTFIDDTRILVGNTRLMDNFDVEYPCELSSIADTVVLCAVGTAYMGHLLLADRLKEDAFKAIEELKALNINNIQILSGDKQSIVTNFAQKLGVTQAYGDLLPEGKVEHVGKLCQDARIQVAFVGDGINDAPVLALSHVGIAMGALGSDAAIETADVVIQTDQPSKVAVAVRAGRQTRRIVWQNVCLAFGVKLFVLILGAGGLATLWEAVFADVGVALIAIVNTMRIQKLIK